MREMEMLIVVAILYATELFYCMFLIYADANGKIETMTTEIKDVRHPPVYNMLTNDSLE